MDAAEILALAVTALNQIAKAIEQANNGDLDAAKANLTTARDHFSTSLDAWDKA